MELTTSAITTITNGLAQHLKANKAIAAFFDDFTEASVNWIRPLFLKPDDTPKKAVEELQKAPDDKAALAKMQAIIESSAEDNPTAETLLMEIAKVIATKTGANNIHKTNSITITGSNNTAIQDVQGSTITIGGTHQHHSGTGDIIAGDKIIHNYAPLKDGQTFQNESSNLKAELSAGKTKAVIEKLLALPIDDEDTRNTIYLILARWNGLQKNIAQQTISSESADVERNKIIGSVHYVLDEIQYF